LSYIYAGTRNVHTNTAHQFVYPFTLEPHVLNAESNRRATIAAHAARREAHLHAREDEEEGEEGELTLLLVGVRVSRGEM
jgi:hypothetical protein